MSLRSLSPANFTGNYIPGLCMLSSRTAASLAAPPFYRSIGYEPVRLDGDVRTTPTMWPRPRVSCQTGSSHLPGASSAKLPARLLRAGRVEGRYLLDRLHMFKNNFSVERRRLAFCRHLQNESIKDAFRTLASRLRESKRLQQEVAHYHQQGLVYQLARQVDDDAARKSTATLKKKFSFSATKAPLGESTTAHLKSQHMLTTLKRRTSTSRRDTINESRLTTQRDATDEPPKKPTKPTADRLPSSTDRQILTIAADDDDDTWHAVSWGTMGLSTLI